MPTSRARGRWGGGETEWPFHECQGEEGGLHGQPCDALLSEQRKMHCVPRDLSLREGQTYINIFALRSYARSIYKEEF